MKTVTTIQTTNQTAASGSFSWPTIADLIMCMVLSDVGAQITECDRLKVMILNAVKMPMDLILAQEQVLHISSMAKTAKDWFELSMRTRREKNS